ncbi:MAG: PAS domain S-box protein [Nitrospirae bacterium]|nr:PAS domain S-box protein [Nitrospirota bacterium]
MTIEESESRFRGILEQSLVGIYIFQDMKILCINHRFAEIFGYGNPDELLGKPVIDMLYTGDHDLV